MSSYNSYVPWGTRSSNYTSGSTNSLDRGRVSGYGGLSNYRPNSLSTSVRERASAAEARNTSSANSYTSSRYSNYVPETPTLRYGSTARFGSQIARSPLSDKSPSVFGVPSKPGDEIPIEEKILLIHRGTSPTRPAESSYLRNKRADREKIDSIEITRSSFKPYCVSTDVQTDDKPPKPNIDPPKATGYLCRLPTSTSSVHSSPLVSTTSPAPIKTSRTSGYSLTRLNESIIKQPDVGKIKEAENIQSNSIKKTESSIKIGVFGCNKINESNLLSKKIEEKPPPLNNSIKIPDKAKEINKSSSSETNSKSTSLKLSKPPLISKSDTTKNNSFSINKDFRKSTLNMDVLSSNESVDYHSAASQSNSSKNNSMKIKLSPSTPKLKTINSVKSVSNGNLKNDSSSSDSSSDDSSELSSDDASLNEYEIKSDNKTNSKILKAKTVMQLSSNEESSVAAKPPLSPRLNKIDEPKSVIVRSKTSATPMKVKYQSTKSCPSSNDEISDKDTSTDKSKSSEEFNHYILRKFDSTDKPWWLNSSESSQIQNNSTSQIIQNSSSPISKTPSNKSLQKTQSNKSLIKTPSNKSLAKTASSNSIKEEEPPEFQKTAADFTPGLNRLHSKFQELKIASCPSEKSINELNKTNGLDSDSSNTSNNTNNIPRRIGYKVCRIESEGDLEWWLDNDEKQELLNKKKKARRKNNTIFLGPFTNIDHILGVSAPPPEALMYSSDESSDSEIDKKIKTKDSTTHSPLKNNSFTNDKPGIIMLDDTALQLYKDGDYGAYLDLEATIDEQHEEFDAFNTKKNSIVLRTQLSVRVHTIIDKLSKSEGRDLRRALFSLKQIFQEDKDLVHEFVQNDGLSCLIKVGTDADQNYQNYILRALGQIMLYVDGMNGVMDHPATIQWLYKLVSSKFRLVVKTALKLLLVFVEYIETNCILLVKAIKAVDYVHTTKPWSNVMKLMIEYDVADTELLIYAMSLINKTLNGLPDQDMYYDQVDALEEQGLANIIKKYMTKQGTDLDLLRQFQIYEAVLQHEDGDDNSSPLKQLDETIRKTLLLRKSLSVTPDSVERRKSRRHSYETPPLKITLAPIKNENLVNGFTNGNSNGNEINQVTSSATSNIRRRRERAERQRSFMREQREAILKARLSNTSSEQSTNSDDGLPVENGHLTNGHFPLHNGDSDSLRREVNVKDLSQKLAASLHSPGEERGAPFGEMKGIVSKAKEGLAKSQSRGDVLKNSSSELKVPEVKKTETELHWEELMANTTKELFLCDLDFRDLNSDDERDVLAPKAGIEGIPPPPPPIGAPPPPKIFESSPHRPPPPFIIPPTPTPNNISSLNNNNNIQNPNSNQVKKTKKTVKLFWKEVRDDPIVMTKMNPAKLLWDELTPVTIDVQKLEHLFESRAKDLITKKQQEMNKNKEVIVLDPKRSNAINIGMTKLPPPRSIKTAILKMDATVMNREGIEKLLTMLPSEEECSKIQDAQVANPDLPLGSAEQFLLTLASISELSARLKLWAFKLDYENCEKEIAEPLMDLKQGMEILRVNRTFRAILGTLLSIGIFLNGTEVKGFQIEYLSKVPEVKDTVHKHSLLHHLCFIAMEKFPDSSDLYSEIGAITRASKVDFDELGTNLQKMEQECKNSFDHLKAISKHDGPTNMKLKISDFLADCAERIIALTKIHRRVMNRFKKFCLWLGIPLHRASTTKPNELCRTVSEFALEYRTTRERVLQQLEKKANHRERNKTRGKMITEVGKFRTKEDRADEELRQLLGDEKSNKVANNTLHGSLPWRRTKRDLVLSPTLVNGTLTDADDEILETLVKTATKTPVTRTVPRERKRTRNADRKSLVKRSRTRDNVPITEVRRTLRNGLSEEERQHIATYIKGY